MYDQDQPHPNDSPQRRLEQARSEAEAVLHQIQQAEAAAQEAATEVIYKPQHAQAFVTESGRHVVIHEGTIREERRSDPRWLILATVAYLTLLGALITIAVAITQSGGG